MLQLIEIQLLVYWYMTVWPFHKVTISLLRKSLFAFTNCEPYFQYLFLIAKFFQCVNMRKYKKKWSPYPYAICHTLLTEAASKLKNEIRSTVNSKNVENRSVCEKFTSLTVERRAHFTVATSRGHLRRYHHHRVVYRQRKQHGKRFITKLNWPMAVTKMLIVHCVGENITRSAADFISSSADETECVLIVSNSRTRMNKRIELPL